MATPSSIQITQGSGTRLATVSYTEGGQTVHDEKMILGEQYLPTYDVNGNNVSIATANTHIIQLMAGSSLNVYVRRIRVNQIGLATSAARCQFHLFRLTTAGTGGTGLSENPRNTADPASGAAGQSGIATPGTEGARLWIGSHMMMQTVPTSGGSLTMFDLDFGSARDTAIIIPAGTSNGIVLKNVDNIAGATVGVNITYSEASF